jgi:hypothetical protein
VIYGSDSPGVPEGVREQLRLIESVGADGEHAFWCDRTRIWFVSDDDDDDEIGGRAFSTAARAFEWASKERGRKLWGSH